MIQTSKIFNARYPMNLLDKYQYRKTVSFLQQCTVRIWQYDELVPFNYVLIVNQSTDSMKMTYRALSSTIVWGNDG